MRYGTWAECAEVCGYVRGPGVPVTRWRVFGGVGAVSCVVSVGLLCVCVVCGVCGVLVDSAYSSAGISVFIIQCPLLGLLFLKKIPSFYPVG